jgi:hypothetical protein
LEYPIVLSIDGVKARVQNYIIGFYSNLNDKPVFLNVAVGINSSVTPSATHGLNWGNLINDLNTWVIINGYNDHVYIMGAIDTETQWIASPYYVDPQAVTDWISWYSYATPHDAYNFGNAADCPFDYPYTEPESYPVYDQVCFEAGWTQNYWSQEKIAEISYGEFRPLPEVYDKDGVNAQQWFRIGLYSKLGLNKIMRFDGSLTQHYACRQKEKELGHFPPECVDTNSNPHHGYAHLYSALLQDHYGRIYFPMDFKTDIIWFKGDAWNLIPGD